MTTTYGQRLCDIAHLYVPFRSRGRITRFGRLAVQFGSVPYDEAENERHANPVLDLSISDFPEMHYYFVIASCKQSIINSMVGECRSTIEDEKSFAAVASLVSHLHIITSSALGSTQNGSLSGALWL